MAGEQKPSMIATVSLNPAVDKTLSVPRFAVGITNRATIERVEPGGKGVNVAKALRKLGCPVVATGFLAGRNGRLISEGLTALGITTDFIQVPGETRVNLKIKDPVNGTETEINEPGFEVEAKHLEPLERSVEEQARRCAVVVFCGALPPGAPNNIYEHLIRIARSRGAKTILDTGGSALRSGMAALPDLIKPNRAEAEEVLETRVEGEEQLVHASHRLLALGPRRVVISLGAEGAVGAWGDQVWRAQPRSFQARSSTGAGDAMVATFAYALTEDLPFDEALRLATAAGSATAAMPGSSVADLGLIREFLPRIELTRIG